MIDYKKIGGLFMKIMAVDYGDARTGVAFSDISGRIAGETLVLESWNYEKLISRLCALAAEKKAEKIIIGLPLNMDGSEGIRAEKSRSLASELTQKTGLEVILQDERRTTVDAHRILTEVGKFGKKRKDSVDAVAASLILETYLNKKK
jgi:putative Holliday junction resolvase